MILFLKLNKTCLGCLILSVLCLIAEMDDFRGDKTDISGKFDSPVVLGIANVHVRAVLL